MTHFNSLCNCIKPHIGWVVLLLLLDSCKKPISRFELSLVDRRSCWEYNKHPNENTKVKPALMMCYKFYDNRTYRILMADMEKGGGLETIPSIEGYPSYEGTWDFDENDSLFLINDHSFKMLNYKSDIIYVKDNVSGQRQIFAKVE